MEDIKYNLKSNEFVFGKELNPEFKKIDDNFKSLIFSGIVDVARQNHPKTLADSVVETSMLVSDWGSNTIPKGSVKPDSGIVLYGIGYISSGANDNASTLKIKFNGTTICTSVGTVPANMVNSAWLFNVYISAVSETQGYVSGYTLIQGGPGITTVSMRSLVVTNPIVFNFDDDITVDVTYQWANASASRSITVASAYISLR